MHRCRLPALSGSNISGALSCPETTRPPIPHLSHGQLALVYLAQK